jgi:hypothetical protein
MGYEPKKKADSLPLGVVKQVKLMAAFHAAGRFIAAKHFKVAKGSSLRPIGNGALFADETKTVWREDMEAFELKGHLKAGRCYGWSYGEPENLSPSFKYRR